MAEELDAADPLRGLPQVQVRHQQPGRTTAYSALVVTSAIRCQGHATPLGSQHRQAHTTGTLTMLKPNTTIELVSRELFVLRKTGSVWRIVDYMLNHPEHAAL